MPQYHGRLKPVSGAGRGSFEEDGQLRAKGRWMRDMSRFSVHTGGVVSTWSVATVAWGMLGGWASVHPFLPPLNRTSTCLCSVTCSLPPVPGHHLYTPVTWDHHYVPAPDT